MTQTSQMIWQAVHHPHAGEDVTQKGILASGGEDQEANLATEPNVARLLAAIQAHEIAELDAVAAYRELAHSASDPVIASLLRVLLGDEEHHHRVLGAIGMNLRALASGAREPRMLPRRAQSPASVEMLRGFARQEQDGAVQLRALAREGRDLFDGLFTLLLNLIAMDSAKHELILRFVVRELEAAEAV